MAQAIQEVNLSELSDAVREARAQKGWTLEQLSHELWQRGYPTAQNKLWRLENKPPKRLDTELLLWLEKVLEVELIGSENKKQVFIEDVVELVDGFLAACDGQEVPGPPRDRGLHKIHDKLLDLYGRSGRGRKS